MTARSSVLQNAFDIDSISDLDNGAMLAGTVLVGHDARAEFGATDGHPGLPSRPSTIPRIRSCRRCPSRSGSAPYSVTLAPRPNMPLLDLYAHAPTRRPRASLSDMSVIALENKLQRPGGFGLAVVQLGRGGRAVAAAKRSTSHGPEMFIAVFALGMALTITIDRMRGLRPVRRRPQEVASS